MLKSSILRFALWLCVSRVKAANSGFWIVPNGNDNDLTQAFPANTPLDLAWSGQPALSTFTSYDNATTEADLFSLFVTGFQPGNSFSQLITSGVNLTHAGTYRWSTALSASVLATSQQYVLRFIIETDNVNGFPSPGFLIQGGAASATSSSSISSSTSTLTSTSTPATTTPQSSITGTGTSPASKSGGLSTSAKIAVGVVVPVVILALLLGAYCCYRRNKIQVRAVGPGVPGVAGVAEVQRYQYPMAAEMSGAHGKHELPS